MAARKVQAAIALQREAQCWEMRIRAKTCDEIGQALGLADRRSAHKCYKRAYARLLKQVDHRAEEERRLDLARADMLIRANSAKAERGDKDAAEVIFKAMKRRAGLLGLNAPKPQTKDIPEAYQFILVEEPQKPRLIEHG